MAKYERRLKGNFDEILKLCDDAIIQGSLSASRENGSDYESNGIRLAVRVYERYSAFGGNRVSLNMTLAGNEDDLFLSAITSGGSRAVFFKINTVGEDSFLETLSTAIENYI